MADGAVQSGGQCLAGLQAVAVLVHRSYRSSKFSSVHGPFAECRFSGRPEQGLSVCTMLINKGFVIVATCKSGETYS